MSRLWPDDQATYRLKGPKGDSWLVTRGTPKVKWARIASGGRIHRVTQVIIRWNFYGGTYEKPDVTFVIACGPQRHTIEPVMVAFPNLWDVCARCDSKSSLPT